MRWSSLIAGCIVSFGCVVPTLGTTINLSEVRKNAALGVHVHPTGPDNLPVVLGGWEVYGSTAAFLNNSVTSRYYSGNAKFDQPVSEVTFDVERLNNSGWRIPFTVIGYNGKKRVAIKTVDIAPLGDTTHVKISAPSINHLAWDGAGWIFHPYAVRDFHVTFVAPVDPTVSGGNVPPPDVGTPVPEPATGGFCGFIGATALLRRRRRSF